MSSVDPTRSFFELFEIPVSYSIDLTSLAERYRTLQHVVHPDKFANATDQQRLLSVQQSAFINEAYQTLKNPLARAKYLLSLKGIDMSATKDTIMAPEFLMEQMELRERLASIKHSDQPVDELINLQEEIRLSTNTLIDDIAALFQKEESSVLNQIRDTIQRLQFMTKLDAEVQAMEEALM